MAGLIIRRDIDEVRSRVNLADVVGEYVTLKSAGSGSMKGLCPFHDERSPSFHVRPQVGYYHCFGCGEGGDVFSFLQKMDHVSFSEAVEKMASQVGVELHYEDGGKASDFAGRARLIAANNAAQVFFAGQLGSEEAEVGRKFLGERGFDQQAALNFGIGFAPKAWDALGAALRAQGFTNEELIAAGLLSQGDRGSYDRFRGRLVWPIRDQTGQTIGFGARKLLEDDKGPKYLNTPETLIYHKSSVLYGLDLARKDIAKARQVVIVEGYTDVMACHLAGITTAVATCGTAFGVEHIKIMRRILSDDDTAGLGEVVFTFDPDAAGQKAALRAFSEEQRFAAQTYVAVAPDGLDPCDLRLAKGDDAVRRLVSNKKPMFEFVIKQRLSAFDLNTVEGRVAGLRQAAPIVADIRDPALRPGYARDLARQLGMDVPEVMRAVDASRRTKEVAPARIVPSAAGEPESITSLEVVAPVAPGVSLLSLPSSTTARLERDALMAMLQHPGLVGTELLERACAVGFTVPALGAIRDAVSAALAHSSQPDFVARVGEQTPEPLRPLVAQLAVAPLPERPERELTGYVRNVTISLIERELVRRKDELLGRLQRTDAAADPEEYRVLQRALVAVEGDRRALNEG